MRSFISALISLVIASSAWAGNASVIRPSLPMELCAQHVPFGVPASMRENTTKVCRAGYALEHDNKAKIPAWVSYTLSPERAVGCAPRVSTFRPDPAIDPEFSAKLKDYAKSGYDIGHLANSADMRWDPQAEVESNVLSNAAPQTPGLNRAAWKMLEDQTRAWAVQRQHSLLIYTGPVYEKVAPTTIGHSQVTVPLSFYKIIVDQQTNEILAFLYPNQESSAPPSSFQTSFQLVQNLTQIIFPIPQRVVFSQALWPASTRSARYEKVKTCILAQKP